MGTSGADHLYTGFVLLIVLALVAVLAVSLGYWLLRLVWG